MLQPGVVCHPSTRVPEEQDKEALEAGEPQGCAPLLLSEGETHSSLVLCLRGKRSPLVKPQERPRKHTDQVTRVASPLPNIFPGPPHWAPAFLETLFFSARFTSTVIFPKCQFQETYAGRPVTGNYINEHHLCAIRQFSCFSSVTLLRRYAHFTVVKSQIPEMLSNLSKATQ